MHCCLVSFPFLCRVKFCSGSGRIRQVVVLYNNECMGICLNGLNVGCFRWVAVLQTWFLNRFDYMSNNKGTYAFFKLTSLIDLVYTFLPNLVVTLGKHPSLHPNCHHQIVYIKFNLKINYPPPHNWEVWHTTTKIWMR